METENAFEELLKEKLQPAQIDPAFANRLQATLNQRERELTNRQHGFSFRWSYALIPPCSWLPCWPLRSGLTRFLPKFRPGLVLSLAPVWSKAPAICTSWQNRLPKPVTASPCGSIGHLSPPKKPASTLKYSTCPLSPTSARIWASRFVTNNPTFCCRMAANCWRRTICAHTRRCTTSNLRDPLHQHANAWQSARELAAAG